MFLWKNFLWLEISKNDLEFKKLVEDDNKLISSYEY